MISGEESANEDDIEFIAGGDENSEGEELFTENVSDKGSSEGSGSGEESTDSNDEECVRFNLLYLRTACSFSHLD